MIYCSGGKRNKFYKISYEVILRQRMKFIIDYGLKMGDLVEYPTDFICQNHSYYYLQYLLHLAQYIVNNNFLNEEKPENTKIWRAKCIYKNLWKLEPRKFVQAGFPKSAIAVELT